MLEAQEGHFQALAEPTDLLPQEQYHRWADVACRQLEISWRWERSCSVSKGRGSGCRTQAVLSLLQEAQRLGELPPPGDTKGQLRHLREHQAFQAEVQAHEEVIMSVAEGVMVSLGDLGQNHEHCLPLLKQLRELQGVWAGAALVQALDCVQRLLWKREKLAQEMGPIQARLAVCGWAWRWGPGKAGGGPGASGPREPAGSTQLLLLRAPGAGTPLSKACFPHGPWRGRRAASAREVPWRPQPQPQQQEMVDRWRQLRSRAQKWCEPQCPC
ncbi:Spectrin beta chain, brain 4 [Myotis brandtii]|uniref:Spectrin beta chain, brain 4 n=1 Tax=Myotis brandtii TaxID=109478 RepID=S7P8F3_MYOBR|nr:Spectrin beta chain, brain 4 [Myotis brandtii]